MIVLDASVLIAFLFEQDVHHEAAVALLQESAAEPFCASSITLAEVLVVPARHGRLPAAERMLADLGVEELSLPRGAAVLLARLRAESGLKMPDCCVLLSALMLRGHDDAASLATFDTRLAAAAAQRGMTVLPA